jgi:plastocyanin
MRARFLLACVAVLLSPLPPVAAAAPQTHVVVIDKMKFGPVPASIRAGDKILWVNKDMFRHTATSKAAGFDVDLPAGARAATVVRKAGAFRLSCRYHPGMRAMLKVSN